jgi:hypothetical protein
MRYAIDRSVIATLGLCVGMVGQASAGPITYDIANYPADQNGATLTGFITTDGTIGVLTSSDIVSWSWTITPVGGTAFTLTSSEFGSEASMRGPVTASLTSITLPDTTAGQPENYFALLGSGNPDLEYDHETGDNVYLGQIPAGTIWSNTNPVLNGSDTWIIATTSVPEPSTLTLLGIAAVCLAGVARRRAA